MKQKKFLSFATAMMVAAASFVSCTMDDNPAIEPDEEEIVLPVGPYEFDEGSLVINGQCAGAEVESYWCHEWRPEGYVDGPALIVADPDDPTNRCAAVVIRSEEEARAAGNPTLDGNGAFADWDSQFFITFPEELKLNDKDQIRLTMRVKADAAQSAGTQSHAAPGAYLHWYCVGDVNFTTEWTDFDSGFKTVGSGGAWGQAQAGMYTIAFNLAKGAHNTVYFDDMRIEVKRYEPDPEPTQIDGYTVLFWDWGTAAKEKYSVKYFKNYTEAKAADGAIVVESLDPNKTYTEYDNAGADAKLAQNWDTQFLISLPKPLAKGTKAKLVMKVKADKATSAETQCHKAIPAPGAIEGKDGYGGTYIHYALLGNIDFTTEWTTIEKDFTVPNEGDGMQAICLNLEVLREINKYYFDDVTVYVEKEWEPEAEEGWDILTYDSGKGGADGTKFQMKYFKNYVAAKAADGAVLAESLDPEKTYSQYDNAGAEAKIAQNWDTQFLIGLPKAVAKGTKMKLQMQVKADKATSGESQAHGLLPKVGAIEGKDGYGGTYLHYQLLGNVPFTTEWKQFEAEFTVPDQGDGMGSICLNLEVLREINKYYFKNIVVRVAK